MTATIRTESGDMLEKCTIKGVKDSYEIVVMTNGQTHIVTQFSSMSLGVINNAEFAKKIVNILNAEHASNTVTISREVYVRVRELVEMRATKDTHPYYQDAVKQFLEAGK
jgi:hypothetical protein